MEKQYLIREYYFHQYAEGITGVNRSVRYFGKNGQLEDHEDYYWKCSCSGIDDLRANPDEVCFKTKREAKQFMKDHGLKNKHIKGRPDYGYGSVGTRSTTYDIREVGKDIIYK